MEITVSSIMRSRIVSCDADSTLTTVARKIIDQDAGSVLIADHEYIVGIITEKDLLRAVLNHRDFESTQAGEVMSAPLDCCNAGDSLEKCEEIFKRTGRTRLAVKREGKIVGVIRRKMVQRFLNTAKRYSLAKIAKTPRFRSGRD